MRAYAIRRLLLGIPTLFIVTVLVFLSVRLIPGDVIDLMVDEMATESGMGSELTVEYLRHALGLDLPIHVQYGKWISGVFRVDFGTSLWTGRPILPDIVRRYPISIELGLLSIIIGLSIALPVGIYSAIRQDTPIDYMGRSFAIGMLALPNFWIATMIMVFPSLLIFKRSFNTSVAFSESRSPVGSSAIITVGSLANARAMPIRCFSPPDSSDGILFRFSYNPIW